MGHITSHESNPLLGLGVACMVFWDELPDAPRMLAWAHGRQSGRRRGRAPRTGCHSWPTYGPQFLSATPPRRMTLPATTRCFATPFFRELPHALLRFEGPIGLANDFNMLLDHGPRRDVSTHSRRPLGRITHLGHPSRHRGGGSIYRLAGLLWHARDKGRAPRSSYRESFLFRDTGLVSDANIRQSPAAVCVAISKNGMAVGGTRFEERRRYGMETPRRADPMVA
jgi:hypothetical protein